MEKANAGKTIPASGQSAAAENSGVENTRCSIGENKAKDAKPSAQKTDSAANGAARSVREGENATKTAAVQESENAAKTAAVRKSENAAKTATVRKSENAAKAAAVQEGESAAEIAAVQESESTVTLIAATPDAPCGPNRGSLPGFCAPLAFPYVPKQDSNPIRYSRMEALETGTLFPGLNLPFKAAIQARTRLANTALAELMALDFAIQELGLYLTTHAEDQEALGLYWSYVQMAKEGREKYTRRYGPLLETDLTPEDGFAWLKDPWPWDLGGNA